MNNEIMNNETLTFDESIKVPAEISSIDVSSLIVAGITVAGGALVGASLCELVVKPLAKKVRNIIKEKRSVKMDNSEIRNLLVETNETQKEC